MEMSCSVDELEPLESLGEGSFGRVFRVQLKSASSLSSASSPSFPGQFACKIFDGDTESNLRDIVQEISIMQTLRKKSMVCHPQQNVGLVLIQGFHLGLTPQDPISFIAMDLCAGGSLSHLLRQCTCLSEAEAATVLTSVAKALLFCHEQAHILHRDIKPANILFAEEGCLDSVRVADFGLAVHTMPEYGSANVYFGPPNEGSPAFMAPEAEQHGHYTPASDVWGLGALLFCMLVGQNPPRPRNTCEVLFDKAGDSWTTLSPPTCSLIKGMLHPDPHCHPTLLQVLQHPWTISHIEHVKKPQQHIGADKYQQQMPISDSARPKTIITCAPGFNNILPDSIINKSPARQAVPACPPGFSNVHANIANNRPVRRAPLCPPGFSIKYKRRSCNMSTVPLAPSDIMSSFAALSLNVQGAAHGIRDLAKVLNGSMINNIDRQGTMMPHPCTLQAAPNDLATSNITNLCFAQLIST
ncbi:hypothetical protein L7F22_048825 [Adiantum nelumboides]|nr:hypothetical protein [Adiantum nelumboides]